MLESTLQKWGFETDSRDSGNEALNVLLGLKHPIVIILDWQMPGMDGIDIVRQLRTQRKEIHHYIIMLTTRSEKNDIIYSLDAGADNFISKPFDPDELKAHINVGVRLISMHHELSKAVQNANRLADFIAHYDQITGLPNRILFTEKIRELISASEQGSLLLLNIDRFKIINQTRGLELGDLLLNSFAARLKQAMKAEAVIARIAADEFGVLVRHNREYSVQELIDNIKEYSAHIHSAIAEEFPIDDGINITVSIGAAPVVYDIAQTPEEFLRRADTALRQAKAEGGNQTVIHDKKMEEKIRERYILEKELSAGIEANQLMLFLQAQVDADINFVGAEALVRWQHPQRGEISPGCFIPIAEETDLIIKLDKWVLDQVCKLLNEYREERFSISVNISPRHFSSSSFVDDVKYFINKWDVDGKRVILEVTEGLLVTDMDEVAVKMSELSCTGIRFSIDDFGTGYSSLSYIKSLPISEIKIDRTFINTLPDDENSAAIVRAIFLMAQVLGLDVVAEGVETEQQAEFLNKTGQPLHQGFLFSKPALATEVLAKWL